jgi:hypothetical protein
MDTTLTATIAFPATNGTSLSYDYAKSKAKNSQGTKAKYTWRSEGFIKSLKKAKE